MAEKDVLNLQAAAASFTGPNWCWSDGICECHRCIAGRLLLTWIVQNGRHTPGCYSLRNSERDCDCGLYDIRKGVAESVGYELAVTQASGGSDGPGR